MDDNIKGEAVSLRPPPYVEVPAPAPSPYPDTTIRRNSRYHHSWPTNLNFSFNLSDDAFAAVDVEKATASLLQANTVFPQLPTYQRPSAPLIRSSHTNPYTSPPLPLTPLRSFAITLTFILVFLIAPLWTLNFIGPWQHQLLLISVIVLFFGGMLAVHTSRLAEVLGATAAYAAVLVVFVHLGNGGNGRGLA